MTGLPAPLSYRDLHGADGHLNASAFEAIVAARTEYEVNLALCVDHGLHVPATVQLGDVAAWRRAQVAAHYLTITDCERAEIEQRERANLSAMATAMGLTRTHLCVGSNRAA